MNTNDNNTTPVTEAERSEAEVIIPTEVLDGDKVIHATDDGPSISERINKFTSITKAKAKIAATKTASGTKKAVNVALTPVGVVREFIEDEVDIVKGRRELARGAYYDRVVPREMAKARAKAEQKRAKEAERAAKRQAKAEAADVERLAKLDSEVADLVARIQG